MTGVDFAGRRLHTGDGPIAYDFLVLACGAQTNYFGLTGVEQHGLVLKDIPDAVRIRNHVLSCFEEAMFEPDAERRRALLTFAVVGGGPTGVEMAGALSELIRLVLVKDYRRLDLKDVRVLLLEAGDRVLAGFPAALVGGRGRDAVEEARRGAPRRHGGRLRRCGGPPEERGGDPVPHADLGGRRPRRAAGGLLGVPTAHLGRVVVEPTLQLSGHPEVFVIGDAAYLEAQGPSLPMMAPVAIQMGETAAANIRRALTGAPSGAVSVPRSRVAGDDRTKRGRRAYSWGVVHGVSRLGRLAGGAPDPAHRVPQPACSS